MSLQTFVLLPPQSCYKDFQHPGNNHWSWKWKISYVKKDRKKEKGDKRVSKKREIKREIKGGRYYILVDRWSFINDL